MAAPKRRSGRSASFEKWTPKDAEEALSKGPSNRNIRQNKVEQYARSMSEKMWGECSQSMVFDWNGHLINGFHRALAQIESKTTQEWLVYRGMNPDSKQFIDTGIPRNVSDQLKDDGFVNYILLGTVGRWCYKLQVGELGNSRFQVSTEEIRLLVQEHPDLEHSAEYASMGSNGAMYRLRPTSLGAAHWWIAQSNGHREADAFMDRVINQADPVGSPVRALVQRFARGETGPTKERINIHTQITMYVRAWNFDVMGKTVRTIAKGSRSGEFELPEVLVREGGADKETQDDDEPESEAS